MRLSLLLLVCKYYTCLHAEDAESSGLKLEFVALIFRHGDRTPIKSYAADPYRDGSHWPEGWGQLTPSGKLRAVNKNRAYTRETFGKFKDNYIFQFRLGQYLRTRYGELLGPSYNHSSIYVRSTDFDRTLMSAEAVLAGLFPAKEVERIDGDMPKDWQPIPIHTVPREDDALLGEGTCRQHEKLLEQVKESKAGLPD